MDLEYRHAVRNKRLGEEAALVYPAERRRPGARDRPFAQIWRTFLERRLARASLEITTTVANETISLMPSSPSRPAKYEMFYLVTSFQEETEDFGAEARVAERRSPHSVLSLESGDVYLPAAEGGMAGPETKYGVRCNVLDEAWCEFAISEKTAQLRPFQGTACEYLDACGVEVDARNAFGETPLMSAVVAGDCELVEWLLAHGADPHARSYPANCPVVLYAFEGEDDEAVLSVVRILAEKGGARALEGANRWGITALHLAAYKGLPRTVRYLLEKSGGALAKSMDSRGRKPAAFAAKEKSARYDESVERALTTASS